MINVKSFSLQKSIRLVFIRYSVLLVPLPQAEGTAHSPGVQFKATQAESQMNTERFLLPATLPPTLFLLYDCKISSFISKEVLRRLLTEFCALITNAIALNTHGHSYSFSLDSGWC